MVMMKPHISLSTAEAVDLGDMQKYIDIRNYENASLSTAEAVDLGDITIK